MMWFTRWKARRELRKAARLLERLAEEYPTSSIQQICPGRDPIEIRNELMAAARRMRKA